jgi:biopolymer transport protein TolQ
MEAETLALAQHVDFSMWGLFARATIVVKIVMLMLIVASFWPGRLLCKSC